MKASGVLFRGEASRDTEPVATVLADTSRWGHNGSMTASKPDWVQLPSGLWVLSFNGTDAEVVITNTLALQFELDFTIKVWCLFDDITNETYALLLGKSDDVDVLEGWELFARSDSLGIALRTGNGSSAGDNYNDPGALVNQRWYHVVGVRAAGDNRVYIDGVTTGTDTCPYSSYTSNVNMGHRQAVFFTGDLGLPEICNYAWSAGQVIKSFDAESHWFGR